MVRRIQQKRHRPAKVRLSAVTNLSFPVFGYKAPQLRDNTKGLNLVAAIIISAFPPSGISVF
jgi:hypothetical protein